MVVISAVDDFFDHQDESFFTNGIQVLKLQWNPSTKIPMEEVRQQKRIAAAVTLSGIAATIFPGGQTAHSAFKLPLHLVTNNNPICNISKGSDSEDECTGSYRGAMEALDKTLQDIRGNNKSMGGYRNSPSILTCKLTWGPMCKTWGPCAEHFSTWLLQLGNGKVPFDGNGDINLAHIAIMVNSPAEMKNRVFPDLSINYNLHKWLCERAILTPKNETVARINHELMNKIPTVIKLIQSLMKIKLSITQQFLNSLELPGTSHKLFLKVGILIMLLRNQDASILRNGTRLIVKTLSPVITATIITGCASGEEVFIQRILIKPTDMPFEVIAYIIII
uniref:ATP-dependent DNA helicase n=1 Tax=Octopus bimaculoides TaxID=37653 RepID=A0A0L8FHT2_OCTBM